MKRSDAEDYEKALMKQLVHLRDIGDFSANAPHVRLLNEVLLKMLSHMIEHMPKSRPKKDE